MKICKCGREILSQPDKSKRSRRVEFAKNKNDIGLVYYFQQKHVNWECDYCKSKKFRRKREKQNDRVRAFYR